MAPPLLHEIHAVVFGKHPASHLAQVQSLTAFLESHAGSVHRLVFDVDPPFSLLLDEEGEEQQEEELWQAVEPLAHRCLSACAAAGALRDLSVHVDSPLHDLGWLPGLTALTKLKLGTSLVSLRLPAALAHWARCALLSWQAAP